MVDLVKIINSEVAAYETSKRVIINALEEMITPDAILMGRVFRPQYGEFTTHNLDTFVDGYIVDYVNSIISNLKSKPFKDIMKGSDFIDLANNTAKDILSCVNFNLSIPFKEHVITLSGVNLGGTLVLVSLFENEDSLITRGLVKGGLQKGIRQVELFYKFGE